jgi:hypothetical protein
MSLTIRNAALLKPYLQEFKINTDVKTDSGAITQMVIEHGRLKQSEIELTALVEMYKDKVNSLQDAQKQLGLSLRPFLDADYQNQLCLDDPTIDNH